MTETLLGLIESASGTLTKLTKIKCVEEYRLKPKYKPKNLNSWPNTFYITEDEKKFLETRNVSLHDCFVKAFEIPYDLYKNMRKVDNPGVESIKATRALLDVFQIVAFSKPINSITAVWDMAKHPDHAAPSCASDFLGVKEFGKRPESYFLFGFEDEEHGIKLRPSVLPVVLQEKPEITGYSISKGDLREYSGHKADRRGRQYRNIVFQSNAKYLREVACQTKDAVERLVDNKNLATEVNKLFGVR